MAILGGQIATNRRHIQQSNYPEIQLGLDGVFEEVYTERNLNGISAPLLGLLRALLQVSFPRIVTAELEQSHVLGTLILACPKLPKTYRPMEKPHNVMELAKVWDDWRSGWLVPVARD